MKLIVGLGNPEPKYLLTPHNIGFMVIDALSETNSFQKKHQSMIQKIKWKDQDILLVKPQTYMNLSGKAIQEILNFYKIDKDRLLVIQDDADQDFLNLKFHKNRGSGGHNGIRNIHEKLNTSDYARLKLGVKSLLKAEQNTANYVLSPFSDQDIPALKSFIEKSAEAVLFFIENDFEKAANRFNTKGTD